MMLCVVGYQTFVLGNELEGERLSYVRVDDIGAMVLLIQSLEMFAGLVDVMDRAGGLTLKSRKCEQVREALGNWVPHCGGFSAVDNMDQFLALGAQRCPQTHRSVFRLVTQIPRHGNCSTELLVLFCDEMLTLATTYRGFLEGCCRHWVPIGMIPLRCALVVARASLLRSVTKCRLLSHVVQSVWRQSSLIGTEGSS